VWVPWEPPPDCPHLSPWSFRPQPDLDWKNIPEELRALPQWVLWRYEEFDRPKPAKRPYQACKCSRPASITSPSTWTTFRRTMIEVYRGCGSPDGAFNGIGLVFSPVDPYFGCDLDNCLIDGEVMEWARGFVGDLSATYHEISPSGSGIKFIGRATLPCAAVVKGLGPLGNGGIELYDRGRFFTVTGRTLTGIPTPIADMQETAESLHRIVTSMGPPRPPRMAQERPRAQAGINGQAAPSIAPGGRLDASGDAMVRRAMRSRSGALFARLWRGDISGFPSQSEADLALMGLLAFWCGKDPVQMEALFGASALGRRGKWRHRGDYRQWTIGQAIAGCSSTYSPGRRG
jgi:primase-polymerase (primpol)-like protein